MSADGLTTLPEDRFMIVEYEMSSDMYVRCMRCHHRVTEVEDDNDLNTLVRLSHAHLTECKGVAK